MKKGSFFTLLFVLGFLCLHRNSQASGYFNVGLTIGGGGYNNYYPSTGQPIYGWGAGAANFGAIGGACGGGCRSPYYAPVSGGGCPYASGSYNPCAGNQFVGNYSPGGGGMIGQAGFPGAYPGAMNQGGMGLAPLNGGLPNLGLPGMNGGAAATMLPPPQPFIPPHMMANNNAGWGPGFASYPGPGMAPIPGSPLCNAGMIQYPTYPVPGGPVMQNCNSPWGGCYATGAASGLNRGIAGGTTIIDMRSKNAWEMGDTGEIVFNAGLGMSSMLTTVNPVAFDRGMPTLISPSWFNFGSRDPDFWARPNH